MGSQSILVGKLSNCKIRGFTVRWARNQQGSEGCSEYGYSWPATSGVPQGSVRGAELSDTHDLGAGVERAISKFADDTKWAGSADSLKGQEALQRDVDGSEHWATSNAMKCNQNKCRIPPLGRSNVRPKYKLGEEQLESSPAERDLGVMVGRAQ
ncbi:rna-directed dna polymerase from mobile element jockey-like [Limosa lapponica baueri]|uniref:Rna-directed dna polymerase from mobile element jockey-like n=1 Tax=Limosa lapponica baueri TaxID=1758121 RepID=A0A2I0U5I5_LIMLA|nr:rna-directed dna polymerase from mobile element jockey-like [Limosa lapponica baueri]